MKRLLLVIPILLLLSTGAFADTITISLFPNEGEGDNFAFIEQGNGFKLAVFGGVDLNYFNAFGYAPGSTLGGPTDVYFDGGVVWINGVEVDIDPQTDSFSLGSLYISPFTLPTNGKPFSMIEFASLSGSVTLLYEGKTIDFGGSAFGRVQFEPSGGVNGLYVPSGAVFTTVPEAGTFALLGTGLIAMLGMIRRLPSRA